MVVVRSVESMTCLLDINKTPDISWIWLLEHHFGDSTGITTHMSHCLTPSIPPLNPYSSPLHSPPFNALFKEFKP